MEALADNVSIHNKHCIGCKRFNSDIMVSFIEKKEGAPAGVEFHDMFISNTQARWMIMELQKILQQNEDPDL